MIRQAIKNNCSAKVKIGVNAITMAKAQAITLRIRKDFISMENALVGFPPQGAVRESSKPHRPTSAGFRGSLSSDNVDEPIQKDAVDQLGAGHCGE